jgi:hypothetical protein
LAVHHRRAGNWTSSATAAAITLECKSYLDSRGVALKAFAGTDSKSAERYKLFSDDNLRALVCERLRTQLAECGACARPDTAVKLCLACGRIATTADREGLHKHFADNDCDVPEALEK